MNYAPFEDLKGNLKSTLLFIPIMRALAAGREELVFRGYYLKQLTKLFADFEHILKQLRQQFTERWRFQ